MITEVDYIEARRHFDRGGPVFVVEENRLYPVDEFTYRGVLIFINRTRVRSPENAARMVYFVPQVVKRDYTIIWSDEAIDTFIKYIRNHIQRNNKVNNRTIVEYKGTNTCWE